MPDATTSTQPGVRDAVFFSPQQALGVALQSRRLPVWGMVDGRQVCYYVGPDPLPDGPDNLVQLHPERIIDVLASTRLRLPTEVICPADMPVDMQAEFIRLMQILLSEACARRDRRTHELLGEVGRLAPVPRGDGRPLRVCAFASRHTQVMQHSSRGVVEAFRDLGHEALLVIEDDDREMLSSVHQLEALLAFNPDLVFMINHHVPQFCPPQAVQVTWWQDLMQELKAPGAFPWRDNDLVYALEGAYFRPFLEAKGLPRHRQRVQHFCVDDRVYRPEPTVPRATRTIVFVGTAQMPSVREMGEQALRLMEALTSLIDEGFALRQDEVIKVAESFGYGAQQIDALNLIWYAIIRDRAVRWMCELDDSWTKEVYGHGWESDPVVRPFHRGVIAPGRPLANLYRRASHALCLQPFILNHERLGQIGCCGCIPVTYDCRRAAEPPHWDDQCLFFRHRAGFLACVAERRTIDTDMFCSYFSYRNFAQRIITDASPHLDGRP